MMCSDGYSAEVPIALWQTKKVYKSKVKMQTTSAPMAWLFLQENVQVQYLQKIALCAKNPSGPKFVKVKAYFLHEVQFSAAIEAAHFPAVETGP